MSIKLTTSVPEGIERAVKPAISASTGTSSPELDEFNQKITNAVNVRNNNSPSIQKTCSGKRVYPLRVDKDGFAIPEPVKRPAKRAAIEKPAQPISVQTGLPLSSATIDYAKRMREAIEKANEERNREKVDSINQQWQSGLDAKGSF